MKAPRPGSARPSPADLAAAANRTIPDVLPGPGEPLHVLFCGINPSLYSAATGWHFARPGNRFWPALHLSGFTPRRLAPAEQDLLGGYGLGITNLVARATAQAAELDSAELRAGGERLLTLIADRRPGVLAVAGVTAYRTAFGRPRAAIGPQPGSLGGARLWILPNPSGLNAHTSVPLLAEDMRRLREALDDAELCCRLSSRTFTTRIATCRASAARWSVMGVAARDGPCAVLPSTHGLSADYGSDAPGRARRRGAAKPSSCRHQRGRQDGRRTDQHR
jgi:TDG/mug DNA glycosylase family protein